MNWILLKDVQGAAILVYPKSEQVLLCGKSVDNWQVIL
jgi:hypothetical protein